MGGFFQLGVIIVSDVVLFFDSFKLFAASGGFLIFVIEDDNQQREKNNHDDTGADHENTGGHMRAKTHVNHPFYIKRRKQRSVLFILYSYGKHAFGQLLTANVRSVTVEC